MGKKNEDDVAKSDLISLMIIAKPPAIALSYVFFFAEFILRVVFVVSDLL